MYLYINLKHFEQFAASSDISAFTNIHIHISPISCIYFVSKCVLNLVHVNSSIISFMLSWRYETPKHTYLSDMAMEIFQSHNYDFCLRKYGRRIQVDENYFIDYAYHLASLMGLFVWIKKISQSITVIADEPKTF